MRRFQAVSSWRLMRIVLCVAIALLAVPSVWAYWPTPAPTLPAQGGKYTDPIFGTTVMRVTDATDGGDSYGTVYGYWPTFSKNNGHIIIHNDTDSTPYLQHFDPTNFLLVGSRTPLYATNPPGGNTPRHDDVIWSGLSPTVVFCHDGLKLWSLDVDSGVWTLIKDFAGAGLPSGSAHLTQMSRSVDDNVFAFDTQDADWNRNGYAAWKRSTNQLLVSVNDPGWTHDEVQLDKTGRYLRATMYDDTNVIWDLDLGTNTTLTDGAPDYAPGHADHGTGTLVNYTNVGGWYLFRNLATPHTWSMVYDWGDNWAHDEDMSYLADDEAWILISTFGSGTWPTDYLRDEVFKLRVDGSEQVQHICHTYSHDIPSDYYTQPRANISRDGAYAAFTSNFANQGRQDMFIVQIPGGGGPQPPVANFTGNPTSGTAPLTVAFTDASTNTPTSWSWNFGDSSTSTAQSPSHVYNNAGSYTVSLRATNAQGYDDEVKTNYITASAPGSTPTFVAAGAVAANAAAITPALPAGIATNDILLLFVETANQAVSIANQNGGTWTEVTGSPQGTGTAAGSGATRLTAFWSRYNGSQGAPTTSDSGNHQVGRIVAIRGCVTSGNPWDVTAGGVDTTVDTSGAIPGATTTVANTLVVAALATALPDADGTANFSAWTNANLTGLAERTDNTSAAGNGGGLAVATGVKATAGGYGTTTVTAGTAAKKGLLSIALKAGGGGGSPPVAAFSGTPTSGAAPLSVAFTDASTNSPTSWSWNFGDSSTSTSQSPSHSYAAGTYTVSLRATNAYGYDDEVKTNYITATAPPPVAAFSGTPTSGTAPLAVAFTDASTNGPTSWSWNFGDSSTSTLQSPSHTYNSAGSYTVSLRATNAGGYDDEVKTAYIAVGVYKYPTSWETSTDDAQVTLISGTLADLQSSNDVYMNFRCNTSSQKSYLRYVFSTGYTPSQVSKINVEFELHGTSTATPVYNFLLAKVAGGTTSMYSGTWMTADSWMNWETTAVSTYMNSSGVVYITICGCPQNTTNYNTYFDTVRLRLTLN